MSEIEWDISQTSTVYQWRVPRLEASCRIEINANGFGYDPYGCRLGRVLLCFCITLCCVGSWCTALRFSRRSTRVGIKTERQHYRLEEWFCTPRAHFKCKLLFLAGNTFHSVQWLQHRVFESSCFFNIVSISKTSSRFPYLSFLWDYLPLSVVVAFARGKLFPCVGWSLVVCLHLRAGHLGTSLTAVYTWLLLVHSRLCFLVSV